MQVPDSVFTQEFELLEASTEVLRAIAHPIRLSLISILHSKKEGASVTEMHELLGIEQAVTSHHLRILKDRNVVSVRRDGKNSIYSLTDERFAQVVELVMGSLS